MSKLYDNYLIKKKENKNKYYLFESGNFYLFLSDDAKYISSISTLKLINLNKEVVKCGFPKIALEKYMEIFKNLKIKVEVVEVENKVKDKDKILDKIKNLKIDKMTGLEALNLLKKVQDEINE